MDDSNHLYGTCACERNQYTIIIPTASTSHARVFFDNSAVNRRFQASPVTAFLRVPLDWFQSATFSYFPDETHTSIRRTFDTLPESAEHSSTRRQFCGYCGTHLTAWNEAPTSDADVLDVTLGSLLAESIDKLEALNIIPSEKDEEDSLVLGGGIDDEDHIDANETMTGTEGENATPQANLSTTQEPDQLASRRMRNRGLPYFEEMVENSRLGRIKRQKGGHMSRDGRTTVQWEVVEIGGDEPTPMGTSSESASDARRSKRQKTVS